CRPPTGSTPLPYTTLFRSVRDVEDMLHQVDGVQTVVTTVGTDEGRNYAQLLVRLSDLAESGRRPQKEIEQEIRERVNRMAGLTRSEEHTSELQSRENLVCR